MSIKVMARVWEHSRHDGTALLLLLALADYSDDEGSSYPSVDRLASRCRMTTRNARFLLRTLQASGELQIRRNEGPKGTNRFRIDLDGLAGLKGVSPLKPVSPLKLLSAGGEAGFRKPLKPASPEPSLNHQEPNTRARKPRACAVVDPSKLIPEADPQTLADWQAVRKAKRAGPITPTVVKALRREAGKAGMPVGAVVALAAERGWQSFKAEWVADARRSSVLHADDSFAGAP